jgi:hypothetical protein
MNQMRKMVLSWSAAGQTRFSSAALSASFSDGAIQIMSVAAKVFQTVSRGKGKHARMTGRTMSRRFI